MPNPESLLTLDFFSPEFKSNAWKVYRELRERGAIHRIRMPWDEPAWLIVRYDEAQAALTEKRLLKNVKLFQGKEILRRLTKELQIFVHHMLSSDPPDHTRLRNLVQQAFTPRMIERMRERIEEIAEDLLDAIVSSPGREVDLIRDYAFPLPIIVISDMLGVPREDRDRFREWSNAVVSTINRPEGFEEIRSQMKDFQDYLGRLFEERRRNPREDLISGLLAAEEQGDRLSEKELYSMVFLLIIAGHETTVNLIGNGVLALLQHPEQMALLRRERQLITTAVEEILRYYSPVEMSTNRWVGEDFSFGGQSFQHGDLVLVSIGSANRDERRFPDPDVFDITREPNPHIAFGKGIHYCLGAPLARMEGQIAISRLLDRLPELHLDLDEKSLPWREDFLMRGLMRLPVRF
ncbi:polyketide biosynthesis cytochrome P450 PksS [Polycladomyces abyssicola]|uniref:Polyketide biosynthesis cytochrome P450 PksS n=1 Tax=Polycladomyces abyssicola TaxID=1125966 RepID=A0A8D5ZQ88_9BACL|nr:cytochrome P450 [Polycladomyces abyssicola]BCU83088.1 polyketide biosynthesis cytochrome P450 PksS [Polycladomyces abyssicola]